jgi:putative acetyltransferase
MSLSIRRERPGDAAEIAGVIDAAFGDTETSAFTEALRVWEGYVPELTFVGEQDGEIVGFTMLSYVGLAGQERRLLILTPMAVRPDRQRQGVGAAVVRAALAAADTRLEPLILCEGVPAYYPRFGFEPAAALGLERPDERIPDVAWMAVRLRAYDPAIRGRVVYPAFFPPPPPNA